MLHPINTHGVHVAVDKKRVERGKLARYLFQRRRLTVTHRHVEYFECITTMVCEVFDAYFGEFATTYGAD